MQPEKMAASSVNVMIGMVAQYTWDLGPWTVKLVFVDSSAIGSAWTGNNHEG